MIPFSEEELLPVVGSTIEKVKPMLALDGGSVKLIGIKKEKVYVQLGGACVGCSASDATLKNGIEQKLKNDIHPDLVVVNVPQGMEDRWSEL